MKKKNDYIKLILIFVIVCLLAILVKTDGTSTRYIRGIKVGDEYIHTYEVRGDRYLFLPSYADREEVDKTINAKDVTIMQSSNIPSVFLTTRSGSLDKVYEDSNHEESGSIAIYMEDGSVNYHGKMKSIKGRGNYSWTNWDKKSYTIDVGDSHSLLGLVKGGKYALVANASDPTLIRNEIARRMEEAVGMEYTFLGEFVDLYINGDYMGNYYICPTICVDEDRVNITNLESEMDKMYSKTNYTGFDVYETPYVKGWNMQDEPEDYTGGYLLEGEFESRYNTEYGENASCFKTDRGACFVAKSPKYCTKRQINYLSNYVNNLEDLLYSRDSKVFDYIDMESWAKWYLVGEVTKNYDAGVSSAYYYKDSDLVDKKLKLASGWDYDMSLGNYLDWMEYYSEDATGLTKLNKAESSLDGYSKLYEIEEYREYVKTLYNDKLVPQLDELCEEGIDSYRAYLKESASMDAVRWSMMYADKGYVAGSDESYDELKDFIKIREEFLTDVWSKE